LAVPATIARKQSLALLPDRELRECAHCLLPNLELLDHPLFATQHPEHVISQDPVDEETILAQYSGFHGNGVQFNLANA